MQKSSKSEIVLKKIKRKMLPQLNQPNGNVHLYFLLYLYYYVYLCSSVCTYDRQFWNFIMFVGQTSSEIEICLGLANYNNKRNS